MPQVKVTVPDVLRVSPMALERPFCHAKPGKDCSTSSGKYARLHLVRVAAAALVDIASARKRKGTKHVVEKVARRALKRS
jgi:hypothetical protein